MIRELRNRVRWYLEWRIRRRALDWVLKFDEDDMMPAERAAFNAWFIKDVRHQKAFGDAWYAVGLTQVAAAQLGSDLLQTTRPTHKLRSLQFLWKAAAAAPIVIMIVALGVRFIRLDVEVYTTRAGESRSVSLPDGTEVALNTRSRLIWRSCRAERCVTFVNGEAYFKVMKNPLQPFIVSLDSDVTIRVVGTEFNVRQYPGSGKTDVTVTRGMVEVSKAGHSDIAAWRRELHANQQLSFGPGGIVAETHSVPGTSVTAWRERTVDVNDTLSSAVCRLAEYLDTPVYVDPAVAQYQVDTVLDVGDAAQTLVDLDSRIVVEQRPGRYIVHERGQPLNSHTPLERCP